MLLSMHQWNTFIKFCFVTAAVMLAVIWWDGHMLQQDITSPGYQLAKAFCIVTNLLLALHAYLTRRDSRWRQDVYGLTFFFYAFHGMAYLDMTYSFAFIECFLVLAFAMRTSLQRFMAVNVVGLLACAYAHYLAAEPIFVAPGHSFKPHSLIVSFIFFVMSMAIHFFLVRYQSKLQELNEKFALVGKQSSFLMHEIKAPLYRMVANADTPISQDIMQDIRRDSYKISALVSSVETLIHRPENLVQTFSSFPWSEVCDDLYLDFNTYLNSMNIQLNFNPSAGQCFGNKHLLYQMLKTMIVNAIEAIGFKDEGSEINIMHQVDGDKSQITVSNTNSFINNKDIHKIFEPYFSTKKSSNKGLGLSLVKSIVEAHHGSIQVTSKNNLTTFRITLPQQLHATAQTEGR
jgi:signal transduction histidine kinase